MPWTSKSAHGHTKSANTPAKKKKWAKIAEGLRKKGEDEGRAIRIANAAIKDTFWDGDIFLKAKWDHYIDQRRKRIERYDPKGRSEGYWEETDDSVIATPLDYQSDADKVAETGEAQKNKKWGIRAHRSGKADPEAGEAGQDQPDQSEWLKDPDGKPLLYENEKDALNAAERHNGMMENMKKMTFHHAKYDPGATDADTGAGATTGGVTKTGRHNYEEEFDRDHGKKTKKPRAKITAGYGSASDELQDAICPTCHGDGEDPFDNGDCPTCGGTGEVSDDYIEPYTDAVYDREFSAKQRKEAASEGEAMKGGGFPIKNKADLSNARQALGRAKNRSATIAHIKKRAKALGEKLPEGWPNDADPFFAVEAVDEMPSVIVPSVFGVEPITSHLSMQDTVALDEGAQVRELENGYVAAMPRIARTGIQIYRGEECGRPDMEKVRVFRPADQVFDGKAVHSYTHLPVTLDHPPEAVNSANWRRYAVGETGDEVLRDGNAVRVPMMLRDSDAIQAFREGTKQLSVGYDCDLDWSDGVTEQGEKYDAIQRGIRANHLAVVAAARGGSTLTIGDGTVQEGETTMNLKTIVVDGYQVQVEDNAAAVIQRTMQALEAKYRDAFKKLKEKEEDDEEKDEEDQKKDAALKAKDGKIAQLTDTIATKDAEIATVKKQLSDAQEQLTPAALDNRVRGRMATIMKAKTLMGDTFKVDGQTVEQLRRAVVESRLGDMAKGWNDGQIEASFNTLQASSAASFGQKDNRTAIDDAVAAFGRPGQGYMSVADAKAKAYADYDAEISQAYRQPNAQH